MDGVGFVGLGVMGGPMAGHLQRSGLPLVVWNRSPEKSKPLAEEGAKVADSLSDLAERCRTVFLCVSRSEDVRSCLEEMWPAAAPRTLFVDHSTILPRSALEIHEECRTRGFRFVDAPITGGSMGAQKGQLTIFCGGEEDDIQEAMVAMKPYTKRAERVGGAGAGQMMKMSNQIAVGGALLALCEALSFAKKAGLDLEQTKNLLSGGAAGSWAFDNYGPKILSEDWSPGFTIKNQRKDFAYCLQSGREIEAALPGTELVDTLLEELEQEGHGDWTTAALYDLLNRMGSLG